MGQSGSTYKHGCRATESLGGLHVASGPNYIFTDAVPEAGTNGAEALFIGSLIIVGMLKIEYNVVCLER